MSGNRRLGGDNQRHFFNKDQKLKNYKQPVFKITKTLLKNKYIILKPIIIFQRIIVKPLRRQKTVPALITQSRLMFPILF